MKNPYLDEYFYVECVIQNGITMEDVDMKFRKTIFDRMDEKVVV